MKWIIFACGLIVGAALAFATTMAQHTQVDTPSRDNTIIFPQKLFSDLGDASVSISGTLTGEDLGYPNNQYVIACFRDRQECWSNYVEQIGHNQVGRLVTPVSFRITEWNASEVVAGGDSICQKTTITLSRKSETALWVEEPINQTRPECKMGHTTIQKFTIEDSPGWKPERR